MDATTYHVAGLGSGGLDALAMTPNMEVMALLMLVLAWLVVIIPTIGMVASADQAPRLRHCSQCGAGPDTGHPSTAAHERPNGARTCRHCHNPAEVYVIQNKDGANPLPLYIQPEWSAEDLRFVHDPQEALILVEENARLERALEALEAVRTAEAHDEADEDYKNGRDAAALARLTSTIRAVLTLKMNRVDLLDADIEVWVALSQMCDDMERGAGL